MLLVVCVVQFVSDNIHLSVYIYQGVPELPPTTQLLKSDLTHVFGVISFLTKLGVGVSPSSPIKIGVVGGNSRTLNVLLCSDTSF